MTDNTMREAFEKWAEDNALNVSWRSGDEYLVADTAAAWRAWQVAQSVPVMGEPVGFILIHENGGRNLTFHDNTDDLADGWSQHKLIIQPTTSITQSVPVVGRNQCDGCNRGLQVCDDGLHREPSGHPVMACTRSEYITSIDAAIAQGKGE